MFKLKVESKTQGGPYKKKKNKDDWSHITPA